MKLRSQQKTWLDEVKYTPSYGPRDDQQGSKLPELLDGEGGGVQKWPHQESNQLVQFLNFCYRTNQTIHNSNHQWVLFLRFLSKYVVIFSVVSHCWIDSASFLECFHVPLTRTIINMNWILENCVHLISVDNSVIMFHVVGSRKPTHSWVLLIEARIDHGFNRDTLVSF